MSSFILVVSVEGKKEGGVFDGLCGVRLILTQYISIVKYEKLQKLSFQRIAGPPYFPEGWGPPILQNGGGPGCSAPPQPPGVTPLSHIWFQLLCLPKQGAIYHYS